MTSIHLRGVTRSFGPLQVLTGVDLDVRAASVTAILGASGCGKTTLLRLLAGFDPPDAGTIVFGTTMVAGPNSWVPAQRRRVGYVAQEGALFPHLTVSENIRFGLTEGGASAQRIVAEVLELVDLSATYTGRYPHELSGGQQQRVALARALAPKPDLVLLDEPFSSLDAALREGTRRAIMGALAATRTTAVLVTHDQAEALSVADQVAVMFDGAMAQVGPPDFVYAMPVNLQVGTFVGEANVVSAELRGDHAACALGTIPTRGCPRSGHGTVLVRPEQIQLSDVDTSDAVLGNVVGYTFYGPTATVELELTGGGPTVSARVATYDPVPPVGAVVGIHIRGAVAAFADEARSHEVLETADRVAPEGRLR